MIDTHLHLRAGQIAQMLIKYIGPFDFVVCMPNVDQYPNGMTTVQDIKEYYRDLNSYLQIENEKRVIHNDSIIKTQFLMTLRLDDTTTAKVIRQCVDLQRSGLRIVGGKLYFRGTTTHSQGKWGVDYHTILKNQPLLLAFREMELLSMPFLGHFEKPDVPDAFAEAACIGMIEELHKLFPKLRIVFEHVSSKIGIDCVRRLGLHGTITLHHILWDANKGAESIHNYCKPVMKTPMDRSAINDAARAHDGRFFFGSDSAYHSKEAKEIEYKPGIFSAPYLITELEKLDLGSWFLDHFARNFYELNVSRSV